MANPRKFSEKIALHNQKQAEETAEFEKIMREVSDATNKGSAYKRQQLHINQCLGTFRAGSLPNVNKVMMSAQLEIKSALSCMDELKSPQGKNHTYRERPRSAVGPMRSRPAEKRIDTSPYSGPYLSPPPDTPWRRTHSDSSLHTSSHDSNTYRKGTLDCHTQLDDYETSRRLCSASPEVRPRSAVDMPRVPGISIYPSTQEPGTIQIPIGNNTGSLPDLTSFHFPSPLNTPLDHEDHNSQFTHSGHSGSPRSLSPQPLMRSGRFNYVSTPPNEAPGPPMAMNHINHTNQLSVPSDETYKYHHHYKGRPHNTYQWHQLGYLPPISSIQQTYSNQGAPAIQTEANSHQSTLTRTSPQHMPQSLTVYKFSSSSPCSSSPQSPPSPTNAQCTMNSNPDHNSYFIGQTNALQHHFEQFSMIDSPAGINLDYIGSTNSSLQTDESCPKTRNHELTPDPGYFSTSPSQHNAYVRGAPETTTPNTPSSIPDIIFTDFSNSDELTKDFAVTMVDSLDQDLFPSDECLREGLDPIDFDGLQMLTDPEIITDPATEDHLRLDRLKL
ncbi:CREB-regulated transcription coactivator 1 isoform X1 [Cimex lectularius]|uniref:CREB-regulated transcription coactivator 1 n=2 Tax=Cimex lectularius TaxID=79782 RepID=A0A8I6STA6_CIMLE|nr:CREB-regulated transcription coactivator 1 isoform X1 [Cimex lectularius]